MDDNDCFACGLDNPVGLKLKFSIEEGSGRSLCRTVIPGHFSGWRGAAHGGIITTLLDETMVYACTSIGWLTVTGTITVKFHRPVPTETPLEVTGTVLRNRGRSITAEGSITVGGVLLASAEGVFIPLKELENPLETFRDRLVP